MAAGGEEQAIGKSGRFGEPRGECMTFEMIDREQRLVVRQRDGFCRGQADDDAANQSRTCRRSNPIERLERNLRLAHRFGDNAIERFDVGAGGDLGDDATEFGVLTDLRPHDIGQNAPAAVVATAHHRGGCFIAGRLDAEDQHRCSIAFR